MERKRREEEWWWWFEGKWKGVKGV